MKICYWSSCQVSFIWLPLFGYFRFKSEQNFGKPNFCIFNLRRPPWFVYLVYLLPGWNIFYCVVFSFYRPFEERTRWALNLHSWKPIYLKIIGLFLLSFWYTTFIFLLPRCISSFVFLRIQFSQLLSRGKGKIYFPFFLQVTGKHIELSSSCWYFSIFWPFIYWTLNKRCLETWSCVCGYCAYGLFLCFRSLWNIPKNAWKLGVGRRQFDAGVNELNKGTKSS